MQKTIDERIKEILLRNVRMPIQAEHIIPVTDLVNDLGLDSILIVNLFVDLEEEFDIDIDVQEISTTILSEYRLLKQYLMEKAIFHSME